MYQLGVRVALHQSRIARCCVRHTIEQKEIGNMKWNNYDRNIFAHPHTLLYQVGKVLEKSWR